MPTYRGNLANYYSDKGGHYAPIGSILPVLADKAYSSDNQSPEYSYQDYLYCDGSEYLIRDYPQLYAAVRNNYGGSSSFSRTTYAEYGGLQRTLWYNDDWFFVFSPDQTVNSTFKFPFPYDSSFIIDVDKQVTLTQIDFVFANDNTVENLNIQTQVAHGFAVGDWVTLYGLGVDETTTEWLESTFVVSALDNTDPTKATLFIQDEQTPPVSTFYSGYYAGDSIQSPVSMLFSARCFVGMGRLIDNKTMKPFTLYRLKEPTQDMKTGLNGQYDPSHFLYRVELGTDQSPFDPTAADQTLMTIDFAFQTILSQPRLRITKTFNLSDTPYQVGTFAVPDLRDRKVVGYGAVDGIGSPVVEDALNNFVGQTGGQWFVSKDEIQTPGVFYTIGDVTTSGYSNITATVSAYLSGSVNYTVGPLGDVPLNKPPTHFHKILTSEASESTIVERGSIPVDEFAACYRTNRASVISFEPNTPNTLQLEHSHGLIGAPLSSGSLATFGNIDGIGDFIDNGDGTISYKITATPPLGLAGPLQYDSNSGYVTVDTTTSHGLSAGDVVSVSGADQTEYNGIFSVEATGLGVSNFNYIPETAPSTTPATGPVIVKLADGYYDEVDTTPQPRMYVVDDQTVIGGKTNVITLPGAGILLSDTLIGDGTNPDSGIVPLPDANTVGETVRIDVLMRGSGGGGASGTNSASDGGYAAITIEIDGTPRTFYAYGGEGGSSGDSGGAGGAGGTVLVPADLVDDPRIVFQATDGSDGQNGNDGGAGGSIQGIPGSGGAGGTSINASTVTEDPVVYTSNQTNYQIPNVANQVGRTVTIVASGGGGGSGPPNANSGCSGSWSNYPVSGRSGAVGGIGGRGKKLTCVMSGNGANSLDWVIGAAGQNGFNNKSGNQGTGSEPGGASNGGVGAATGGAGGQGAWGNGGTGGAGGGVTGVYASGNAFMGAGGGGGGGGSGGGYNGGGTTDGCYGGANGIAGTTDQLLAITGAMDFENGANGTSSGCTSGGGGGGGAGAGTNQSAQGGTGGSAGAGHNGNGGGSGGSRGSSAYRTNFISSASANNLGSPAGSGGYVSVQVTYQIAAESPKGGGGGEGGRLVISFGQIQQPVAYVLQGPSNGADCGANGCGGSTPAAGTKGSIQIQYYGQEEGTDFEGQPTVPNTRFYLCNAAGVPEGAPSQGNITQSSSDDVDVFSPGTGSGASGGFAIPAGTGAPSFDGKVTKYIKFTGAGDRELKLGPLDLADVEKLQFLINKGSGLNGGDVPEEDLAVYYSVGTSNAQSILDTAYAAATPAQGWVQTEVTLADNSPARNNDVTLYIKQIRPTGGDNASATGDNYGFAGLTLFYAQSTGQVFVPTANAVIPGNAGGTGPDVGIDVVRRNVPASKSGIAITDGVFTMTSSTPISTTALSEITTYVPLVTKYHRCKYIIKST